MFQIKNIAKSSRQWSSCLALVLSMGTVPLLSTNANGQSIPWRGVDVIPNEIEMAYRKGLKYLAKSQTPNGAFGSGLGAQPGLVGICVLSFLAHGEDPVNGQYAKNIQNSIDFLVKAQNKNTGMLGISMYNHGFATLALAEIYGMVDDKRVEKTLQKAVNLIVSSQERNPTNAWRYGPDEKTADTTVAGCQIVALLAARNAGIPVADKNIDKALAYMASCRASNGGYGYTSKRSPRTTLTAIGSLCLSLAKQKDDKAFPVITKYLKNRIDDSSHHYIFYHEYYMAQALFHADEELWQIWNEKNTKLITSSQMPDGNWNDRRMGPSGATGFALLSMALNYRFLPIYEK